MTQAHQIRPERHAAEIVEISRLRVFGHAGDDRLQGRKAHLRLALADDGKPQPGGDQVGGKGLHIGCRER